MNLFIFQKLHSDSWYHNFADALIAILWRVIQRCSGPESSVDCWYFLFLHCRELSPFSLPQPSSPQVTEKMNGTCCYPVDIGISVCFTFLPMFSGISLFLLKVSRLTCNWQSLSFQSHLVSLLHTALPHHVSVMQHLKWQCANCSLLLQMQFLLSGLLLSSLHLTKPGWSQLTALFSRDSPLTP